MRAMMSSILIAGLLLGAMAAQGASAREPGASTFPKVAAVSKSATNAYLPGKAIWVDLVTTDVVAAATFYQQVFGWDFNYLADNTYADASYQGRPVGSITVYDDDEASAGDAQWLVSFSSSDIDAAISRIGKAGGKVLKGPLDLDGRGRLVLISDPSGAELMLLHATGGDPADQPAVVNEWLWAELWTDDTASAAEFYLDALGLKSRVVEEPSGQPYLLLGRDGVARAGVVELPFEGVEPNWMPYILVKSVKDTVETIEKYGGKLVMAPGESADDVTAAIVSDPTGGVFAIQQRNK
jgi:predicted enzyme related to lactoylglutathione lyase